MRIGKIIFAFLFGVLFYSNTASSQNYTIDLIQFNRPDGVGQLLNVDSQGNLILGDNFSLTIDIDPGTGIFNVTPNGQSDFYIKKLDSNGNFIWGKKIGGVGIDQLKRLVVDDNGNIYALGHFSNNVDFDPGSGVFNLSTINSSSRSTFVLKLDSNGNFLWARKYSFQGNDWILKPDFSGNLYICGGFTGTIDFDPGPGTFNLSSSLLNSMFISKLDSRGYFYWAKKINSNGVISSTAISFDKKDEFMLTGKFNGTIDFDPGPGNNYLISNGWLQTFILKLTKNGQFIWAAMANGLDRNSPIDIALDLNDNITVIGWFVGTVDFDPDTNAFNLTNSLPNGRYNTFIWKLNSSGNLLWANQIEGGNDLFPNSIVSDSQGNLYTTGSFLNSIDFDPGTGVHHLISQNQSSDIYILKLDSNGNFSGVNQISGNLFESATNLYADKDDGLFLLGQSTSDSLIFNLGGTPFTLHGQGSFLLKLKNSTLTNLNQENQVHYETQLYPNPSNGPITLSFDSPQAILHLSLYSISGQLLQKKTYQNQQLIEFEIQQKRGVYMLEVADEKGNKQILKVVKD